MYFVRTSIGDITRLQIYKSRYIRIKPDRPGQCRVTTALAFRLVVCPGELVERLASIKFGSLHRNTTLTCDRIDLWLNHPAEGFQNSRLSNFRYCQNDSPETSRFHVGSKKQAPTLTQRQFSIRWLIPSSSSGALRCAGHLRLKGFGRLVSSMGRRSAARTLGNCRRLRSSSSDSTRVPESRRPHDRRQRTAALQGLSTDKKTPSGPLASAVVNSVDDFSLSSAKLALTRQLKRMQRFQSSREPGSTCLEPYRLQLHWSA